MMALGFGIAVAFLVLVVCPILWVADIKRPVRPVDTSPLLVTVRRCDCDHCRKLASIQDVYTRLPQ